MLYLTLISAGLPPDCLCSHYKILTAARSSSSSLFCSSHNQIFHNEFCHSVHFSNGRSYCCVEPGCSSLKEIAVIKVRQNNILFRSWLPSTSWCKHKFWRQTLNFIKIVPCLALLRAFFSCEHFLKLLGSCCSSFINPFTKEKQSWAFLTEALLKVKRIRGPFFLFLWKDDAFTHTPFPFQ